jgi:hypothetical protein
MAQTGIGVGAPSLARQGAKPPIQPDRRAQLMLGLIVGVLLGGAAASRQKAFKGLTTGEDVEPAAGALSWRGSAALVGGRARYAGRFFGDQSRLKPLQSGARRVGRNPAGQP